jgi:predicted amidophosphoribosyltransferase
MLVDLSRLNPQPTGFGKCEDCSYRDVGSAAICFTCASRTIDALPHPRCGVCEQALDNGGRCGNPICDWADRGFEFSRAISMMTGVLDQAIRRYKYKDKWGWAWIFGRVVVGHLDAHSATFEDFDIIAASPTYVGESGRSWDHIGLICERAAIEAGNRWPFDVSVPRIIVQERPTTRTAGKTWRQRYDIANRELRAALRIPDPELVRGRSVLLVDDVFTTGLTTHVVGQEIRAAGATRVAALVLARQPFGGNR